jgi:hypothetical protein
MEIPAAAFRMKWPATCRLYPAQAIVFLVATLAGAQEPAPSTQEVLSHARANIAATVATLPDVFCDEKIDSSELNNGKVKRKMTFDSVVAARRLSGGDSGLTESRDVRLVDGKPPKQGKRYVLPFTLNGGFGIHFSSFLSAAYDQCNLYRIVEGDSSTGDLIGLEVSRKVNSKQIAGCEGLSADAVYRFWLDRLSYGIRRVETVDLIPDGSRGFKSLTRRNDFAVVQLGPKSYLQPASVRAIVTIEPESSEQFSFEAHYSNCHKFEVTSDIVSGSVEVPR